MITKKTTKRIEKLFETNTKAVNQITEILLDTDNRVKLSKKELNLAIRISNYIDKTANALRAFDTLVY